MLKSIYKILPYFIVEYLAMKRCERIYHEDDYVSFTAFNDAVIIKRVKFD